MGDVNWESRFRELLLPAIKSNAVDLYDLEYLPGSKTLRIYIINKHTQTAVIEECAAVDRALTPVFESEEWIPEGLILEVSSPGIYRKLKTLEHFQMAIGKQVSVTLMKALVPTEVMPLPKGVRGNMKFKAVLDSINGECLEFSCNAAKFKLDFSDIKRANLDPDIG